jgi:hypothetical protein
VGAGRKLVCVQCEQVHRDGEGDEAEHRQEEE